VHKTPALHYHAPLAFSEAAADRKIVGWGLKGSEGETTSG